MSLPRDSAYALCSSALLAIVNRWPDPPVEPLPERQNVANGEVFFDCESLQVACERIYGVDGDVSAETWIQQAVGAGFRSVGLSIWLVRCVPDLDSSGDEALVPPAADLDESAEVLLGDAVTVWNLLQEAQDRGELATCSGLAFQDWTPVGPLGGFGGGVTRVRALLL